MNTLPIARLGLAFGLLSMACGAAPADHDADAARQTATSLTVPCAPGVFGCYDGPLPTPLPPPGAPPAGGGLIFSVTDCERCQNGRRECVDIAHYNEGQCLAIANAECHRQQLAGRDCDVASILDECYFDRQDEIGQCELGYIACTNGCGDRAPVLP